MIDALWDIPGQAENSTRLVRDLCAFGADTEGWAGGSGVPLLGREEQRERGVLGNWTGVLTRSPQDAMPLPPLPWSSSSKAASQLGAPRFGRQRGEGPGGALTWLEQSTCKRHGFPAFIKRRAANNAAIWQVG